MPRNLSSTEIIRRLEADGWVHARTRGDHHQFKKEGVAALVTVPHPKKDVPRGTLRSIWRAAGWEWPPA